MVHTYHIGTEAATVIDIRLSAGHTAPDEVVVQACFLRLGGYQTGEQFIMGRLVVFRLIDRDAVFKAVRQAYTEIVGLNEPVAGAGGLKLPGAHAPKQPAGRRAGRHERIHSVRELMPVEHLDSVPRLAVFFIAFTPDTVFHSCGGHQVALIGTVDKPGGGESQSVRSVCDTDAGDVCAVLDGIHQVVVFNRFYARVLQILLEDFQRGTGFEYPVFQIAVVSAQPAIELQSQALHHLFVSYIRLPEAASRHSAETIRRLDDHDIQPFLRSAVGRHHSGRSPAVD